MKRVLFIQHGDTDKPGLLGEVLDGLGIEMDVLHPYVGHQLSPSLKGYDGLALGGGAQSAYEQDIHPYLAKECALVLDAVATGKPAIGLCLGAQLMAMALGAEVRRAPQREIGLLAVDLEPAAQSDPVWAGLGDSLITTHWHGDVFEIPDQATRLASSLLTSNQLFRYGTSLYGLQFHLEMTPEILEDMIDDSAEYLSNEGVDLDQLKRDGRQYLPRLENTARAVFTRWAALL